MPGRLYFLRKKTKIFHEGRLVFDISNAPEGGAGEAPEAPQPTHEAAKKAAQDQGASDRRGVDAADGLVPAPEEEERGIKTLERLLEYTEIEIKKGRFVFEVEGLIRSFRTKPEQLEELTRVAENTNINGVEKCRQAKYLVYDRLLQIINKDGSVRRNNPHKVKTVDGKIATKEEFNASNQELYRLVGMLSIPADELPIDNTPPSRSELLAQAGEGPVPLSKNPTLQEIFDFLEAQAAGTEEFMINVQNDSQIIIINTKLRTTAVITIRDGKFYLKGLDNQSKEIKGFEEKEVGSEDLSIAKIPYLHKYESTTAKPKANPARTASRKAFAEKVEGKVKVEPPLTEENRSRTWILSSLDPNNQIAFEIKFDEEGRIGLTQVGKDVPLLFPDEGKNGTNFDLKYISEILPEGTVEEPTDGTDSPLLTFDREQDDDVARALRENAEKNRAASIAAAKSKLEKAGILITENADESWTLKSSDRKNKTTYKLNFGTTGVIEIIKVEKGKEPERITSLTDGPKGEDLDVKTFADIIPEAPASRSAAPQAKPVETVKRELDGIQTEVPKDAEKYFRINKGIVFYKTEDGQSFHYKLQNNTWTPIDETPEEHYKALHTARRGANMGPLKSLTSDLTAPPETVEQQNEKLESSKKAVRELLAGKAKIEGDTPDSKSWNISRLDESTALPVYHLEFNDEGHIQLEIQLTNGGKTSMKKFEDKVTGDKLELKEFMAILADEDKPAPTRRAVPGEAPEAPEDPEDPPAAPAAKSRIEDDKLIIEEGDEKATYNLSLPTNIKAELQEDKSIKLTDTETNKTATAEINEEGELVIKGNNLKEKYDILYNKEKKTLSVAVRRDPYNYDISEDGKTLTVSKLGENLHTITLDIQEGITLEVRTSTHNDKTIDTYIRLEDQEGRSGYIEFIEDGEIDGDGFNDEDKDLFDVYTYSFDGDYLRVYTKDPEPIPPVPDEPDAPEATEEQPAAEAAPAPIPTETVNRKLEGIDTEIPKDADTYYRLNDSFLFFKTKGGQNYIYNQSQGGWITINQTPQQHRDQIDSQLDDENSVGPVTILSPDQIEDKFEQVENNEEYVINILTHLAKKAYKRVSDDLGIEIEREIKLVPTHDGSQNYHIEIDGKKSEYLIRVADKKNLDNDEMELMVALVTPTAHTDYLKIKEWTPDHGKREFVKFDEFIRNAALSVPNEKEIPANKLDKAIANLEKSGLTFPNKPETLTIHQYRRLQEISEGLMMRLNMATHTGEMLNALWQSDFKLLELLSDSDISAITINTNPPLEWTINKALETAFETEEGLSPIQTGFDASINKLKRIKLDLMQTGGSAITFGQFNERSASDERASKRRRSLDERVKKYRKSYKTLTEKSYKIGEGVYSLGEAGIEKEWLNIKGYKRVEELMSSYPFDISREAVGKLTSQAITEWSNKSIDFEDLFKFIGPRIALPGLQGQLVGRNILRDHEAFLDKFEELDTMAKTSGWDKNEGVRQLQQQLYETMLNDILVPCLELLEAIQNLKYTPNESEEKPKKKPKNKNNEEIAAGLRQFTEYSERSQGTWESFLTFFDSDEVDEITMANVDGRTFSVDNGFFRRHVNPERAIQMIVASKDFYTIEDEAVIVDHEKVTEEVNRLIKLGFANEYITKNKLTEKTPEEIQEALASDEFKSELDKLLIKDIRKPGKISDRAKMLFQRGFIIDQASQETEQIERGKENLTKSPFLRKMVDDMIAAGFTATEITKAQEATIAIIGVTYNYGTNEFEGIGIGRPIKISEDLTLVIGVAGILVGDKQIVGGAALTYSFYRNEERAFSAGLELDFGGLSAGLGWQENLGEYSVETFVGGRLDWTRGKILPQIGANVGLSVNVDRRLARQETEALDESGYKTLFEEWDNIPRRNVPARLEVLKKMTAIWNKIEPIKEEFDLKDSDIVFMFEGIREELQTKVLENLSNGLIDVPVLDILTYVGVGVGLDIESGATPFVLQIGVRIGSALVYIPNRRAINRMKEDFSDAAMTRRLEYAVGLREKEMEEAGASEESPSAFEHRRATPDLIYTRTGEIMRVYDAQEVDFGDVFKEKEELDDAEKLEQLNKNLNEAEIKVEKVNENTHKFKILNTDNRDTEVHVDPLLTGIKVYEYKGEIHVEGDISSLIVTRERFQLPFEGSTGVSGMRDVIVIRDRRSVYGKRDREWLEKNEGAFFQKLEDENGFIKHDGNAVELGHTSIIESKEPEKLGEDTEGSAEAAPEEDDGAIPVELSEEQVDEIESMSAERQKGLEGIKSSEFAKQTIREDLYKQLDRVFKRPAFKAKFGRIADQPEKIIELIAASTDKLKGGPLNDQEMNHAYMHALNTWFTTVYPKSLDRKKRAEINKKIERSLIGRINFTRGIYAREFQDAIDRMPEPKPQASAQEMANKILIDTYGDPQNPAEGSLLWKIRNNQIDFRDVRVTPIPEGATLYSGARGVRKQGGKKAVLAKTINYKSLTKNPDLVHPYGFLEGTTKNYPLNGGPQIDNDIARVLLEVISPLPKEDAELLQSPLAVKILSMPAAHTMLMIAKENGNVEAALDHMKALNEIIADPTLLQSSEQHQAQFAKFREFLMELRAHETTTDEPYEALLETPDGKKVRITLSLKAEVGYGAYTKCANASFYGKESGHSTIQIEEKPGEDEKEGEQLAPIGLFEESTETLEVERAKKFYDLMLLGGFRKTEAKKTRQKKDPDKGSKEGDGGKDPGQGPRVVETEDGQRTVDLGPGAPTAEDNPF